MTEQAQFLTVDYRDKFPCMILAWTINNLILKREVLNCVVSVSELRSCVQVEVDVLGSRP